MSSVHGLNNLRDRQDRQRQQGNEEEDIFAFIPSDPVIREAKHPKNENFWDMWQLAVCPRFQFKSITFVACCFQVAYFIIALVYTYSQTSGPNNLFFLGLNDDALRIFGIRMPYTLKADYFQLQRFILPTFLHFGFTQLIICIIAQMIIGSLVESILGSGKMVALYILSSFGANIFAAMCSPMFGLGSEVIVMAEMAFFFSMLIVYWNKFGDNFCTKICAVFIMLLLVFVVGMVLSQSATMYTRRLYAKKVMYPDLFAWIGGFITSFFLTMCLLPPLDVESKKRSRREQGFYFFGIFATMVFLLTCTVLFYVVSDSPKIGQ